MLFSKNEINIKGIKMNDKNDIEFNININKKLGVALLTACGLFAMAEHQSTFSGDTPVISQSETMTIGSVVLRMDNVNPATIYGGTWELIQGDAALRLGNGTNQTTIIEGSDNVNMPIPKHNHDMTHTHTRGTMNFTGHFPTIITNVFQDGTGGAFWADSNAALFQNKSPRTVTQTTNYGIYFTASRNWTGNTSQPDNLNASEEGVDNATVNVKGAHINLNIWKRTL